MTKKSNKVITFFIVSFLGFLIGWFLISSKSKDHSLIPDEKLKRVSSNVSGTETTSSKILALQKYPTSSQNKNDVVEHPDGSVTIPPRLLQNIVIFALNQDGSLNFEEIMKFGFSERQCEEVNELITDLRKATLDEESNNFRILKKEGENVLMEIPGNSEKAAIKSQILFDNLRGIGGDRGELLVSLMDDAFEGLTYSFGASPRLIRLGEDSSGTYKFEVLQLPMEKIGLDLETHGFDVFRGAAVRHREYSADKLPKRLEHLFEKER